MPSGLWATEAASLIPMAPETERRPDSPVTMCSSYLYVTV